MWHNLLARLKATPPWVWITVAIAAAGLVISFLIYRQQQGNPSSSSTSPVNPGDTTGGYSPYGNNSSQYQPDYTTQSLLQQIINLLQGQQPKPGGTPPKPKPKPKPKPGGTPPPGGTPGAPGALPPAMQHHPITGRPAYSPPSVQPHPITGHPGEAPPPMPRPIVGSVAHADDHRGTRPHPGAIMVTPSSHHPGQTA